MFLRIFFFFFKIVGIHYSFLVPKSGNIAYAKVETWQITEKMKPHPVVINLLTKVEDVIPKWKIVPTKDVINAAFKDPAKRERVRFNLLSQYIFISF